MRHSYLQLGTTVGHAHSTIEAFSHTTALPDRDVATLIILLHL
jgi:hypothetical protein